MSAQREQDYYTAVRAANKAVWDGINTLKSLQAEWNAMDYGNELGIGQGTHTGLTKTEVGAVVFDTANALLVVLAAGSATNMAKLL